VPQTIEKMASMLKLKGELYLVVPSFEWAAQQVASPEPHPLIHIMTCGTDKIPHRSVLTLQWLRLLAQQAHLAIAHATPEIYKITIEKDSYEMVRNVVIGWKYDEFDPASAIGNPGDMA
jgi:hypothetical protein